MARTTSLLVNGSTVPVDVDAETSLLTVLRDYLDLTGSKYGCGEGQCGARTVLIDGSARRACITQVGTVAQKQITTIEGLAKNGDLLPALCSAGVGRERKESSIRPEGLAECGPT